MVIGGNRRFRCEPPPPPLSIYGREMDYFVIEKSLLANFYFSNNLVFFTFGINSFYIYFSKIYSN